jgi:hypothetical protein
MKKRTLKKTTHFLKPLSAFAAMIALGVPGADAQTTPVFSYSFPASYNGTGTAITDLSPAGNNGTFDGTLSLSSAVPPGAAGGTESVVTTAGGILTSQTASLKNAAVAAAGGFSYNVSFDWNGTDSSSFGHTEKIIDYSGTESLQLVTSAGGVAALQMVFGNDAGVETVADTFPIVANTWYNVAMSFNTLGAPIIAGDISGVASLEVNGTLVGTGPATKGTYGDGLNRPIGIGQLGAPFGYLVGFKGDIYNPSVSLGAEVVPEPTSTALLSVAGGLGMAWKLRRRKA